MALDLRVDSAGLAESLRALGMVDAQITEAARIITLQAAQRESLRLAQNTPVRTGRLQVGWNSGPDGTGASIENEVPYGPFLITGTNRMSANPALKQAWDDAPSDIADELGRVALEHLR